MIKRELYMNKIRPFMNGELIKVMTGLRRSGKSVMLDLIRDELLEQGCVPEQFIAYNFEKMGLRHLCHAEALYDEVIERARRINGKVYLFFDEIQEVNGWERCINSLRVELDCDIYITGSNAKLLSGELATYLGGRYVEFVIYPFSFTEFKQLYQTVAPEATESECFQTYLKIGGMPYLSNLKYNEAPCNLYLEDLYHSVVLKDIVERNSVRDVDLLEKIIAYVISNVGMTFSANSISKYFKSENRTVAPETILNYIKYCANSYLFYQVRRENLQGKQVLSTNEKYYMVDHGIREAVFGGNSRDINQILENIVFMELQRRGYKVTVGKIDDKEIDFICHKQDFKIYIQTAYLLASEATIEREFGILEDIRDNFPKYVVTMDEIDCSRNGIKHCNIKQFLQMDSWE